MTLTPAQRRFFLDECRDARAQVLKDTENFASAIHAIERFGRFLNPRGLTLRDHKTPILEFCQEADTFQAMGSWSGQNFESLYAYVHEARNESMHVGATARHAASNAMTLLSIIEDALVRNCSAMNDFMISDPVCTEMWQQVGLIRQKMLTNSFSFLPVIPNEAGAPWQLISDAQLSRYLRSSSDERKKRLAASLHQAVSDGVQLQRATCRVATDPIDDVLEHIDQRPVLLFDDADYTRLLGLITAFDLL